MIEIREKYIDLLNNNSFLLRVEPYDFDNFVEFLDIYCESNSYLWGTSKDLKKKHVLENVDSTDGNLYTLFDSNAKLAYTGYDVDMYTRPHVYDALDVCRIRLPFNEVIKCHKVYDNIDLIINRLNNIILHEIYNSGSST